jgi:2-dehydro-3-deoxygluconokinase
VIVTLGEALVCAVPSKPVALDRAESLQLLVGGAEVNFAVGVRRLGAPAAWIGWVGDDSLGRLVRTSLEREGVETRWVGIDGERPTGLYLREWLEDGTRRPYYYRRGSAAERLDAVRWPASELDGADWLHVTGITAALGPAQSRAVDAAVDWATERGIPVSLDPNYRPTLWSVDEARPRLEALARRCQVLLASTEDAELLFGTTDPDVVIERARALGIETVVLKLGAEGAVAWSGDEQVFDPAAAVDAVIDPVGAGDGFDAGFVAALRATGDLRLALRLGNHVGARAVEALAEHAYPRADELPEALRAHDFSRRLPRFGRLAK